MPSGPGGTSSTSRTGSAGRLRRHGRLHADRAGHRAGPGGGERHSDHPEDRRRDLPRRGGAGHDPQRSRAHRQAFANRGHMAMANLVHASGNADEAAPGDRRRFTKSEMHEYRSAAEQSVHDSSRAVEEQPRRWTAPTRFPVPLTQAAGYRGRPMAVAGGQGASRMPPFIVSAAGPGCSPSARAPSSRAAAPRSGPSRRVRPSAWPSAPPGGPWPAPARRSSAGSAR